MEVKKVDVGGHHMVRVKIGTGYGPEEDLTPLEAEHMIKELRRAVDSARAANRKPTKFGQH